MEIVKYIVPAVHRFNLRIAMMHCKKEIMRVEEAIRIVCVKNDLTFAEVARRLGVSPQAFGQKLKREKLSVTDIDNIASVCGCKLECNFILAGGEKVPIVGRGVTI